MAIVSEDERNEPPNGGWGWVVVLGTALINMVNESMLASFGLIFGSYLKDLAGGTATGLTSVMTIALVVTNLSGLLVGPLNKVLSVQVITFIGIFCVGGGMIISSFSTAIWQICIAYGIVTGIGVGLTVFGTFLSINKWFTTKKSIAVGISMAGTSLGQMVMPTLIGKILEEYGFHGTALTIGLMCYSGFLGVMLFEPIFCFKKSPNSNTGEKNTLENDATVKISETTPLIEGNMRKLSTAFEGSYRNAALEVTNSKHLTTPETFQPETPFFAKISTAIGFPLLKDPVLVNILLGLGFSYVSTVTFGTFFPIFLQEELELSITQTTTCMTVMSFADFVGRFTSSVLYRKMNLSDRESFMMGALLLLIARSCLAALKAYIHVLIASFVVGYLKAITVINQNLVIAEYVEKDKLPQAIGINMVTKAVCTSILILPLGYLKDLKSYSFCIHLLDIVLGFVVTAFLVEKMILKWRQ